MPACGFPLMCHNHSNHHHNPSQPGLLLLGCITELCHSTPFHWCSFFFLAKQLPALFYSQHLQSSTHPSRHHSAQDVWRVRVRAAGRHFGSAGGCSPGALPAPLPLGPRLSSGTCCLLTGTGSCSTLGWRPNLFPRAHSQQLKDLVLKRMFRIKKHGSFRRHWSLPGSVFLFKFS